MKTLILSCILLLSSFAFAQQKNLVERVVELESKEKNPVTARSIIINQATEKVSEDMIKEIIGEAKYQRNKSMISAKILKQSPRFIPFSKPGEMKPLQPEGFRMSVSLRVSVDDLQTLLLENGLFYESDSTPVVLPVIRFNDRVNTQAFAWWLEDGISTKPFLQKENRNLEDGLKSAFLKNNFYVLKPSSMRLGTILPQGFKTDTLRFEDQQLLAQKLNSQIVIDGEISLAKSQERSDAVTIAMKMTALQVVNGRVIAEVTRQFETDGGNFELVTDRKLKEVLETVSSDLSSQVLEAWQKGALGASLYRLSIRGRLPLQNQEAFKEALKSKVREVKNVTERVISMDGLVYEVDSALGPKDLGQKAPKIEVGNLSLVLESASETEVIYRVQR